MKIRKSKTINRFSRKLILCTFIVLKTDMKFKIIIFSILLCSSCVSVKQVEQLNREEHNGIKITEGTCSNLPQGKRNYYNRTLLEQVSRRFILRDSLDTLWRDYDMIFSRNEFDDKTLYLRVLDGDEFVTYKEIKGKWKNNSFYVRRLMRPVGVPFIFYWYYEKKLILTFTETALHISKGESRVGMVFLASGGGNDYSRALYIRKE